MGFLSNAANKAAKNGKIDSATAKKVSVIDKQTIQKVEKQIEQKMQQGIAGRLASTQSQMEKYQGESSGPCDGCSGGLCPGCGGFSEEQVNEFIEYTNQNPEVYFGRATERVDLKFAKNKDEEEKLKTRVETAIQTPGYKSTKNNADTNKKNGTGQLGVVKLVVDEGQKRRVDRQNIKRLFSKTTNIAKSRVEPPKIPNMQMRQRKEENKLSTRGSIVSRMGHLLEPQNRKQTRKLAIQIKYVKNNLFEAVESAKRGEINYEKYENAMHARDMLGQNVRKVKNLKIKIGAKKVLDSLDIAFLKLRKIIGKLKKKNEKKENEQKKENKKKDKQKEKKSETAHEKKEKKSELDRVKKELKKAKQQKKEAEQKKNEQKQTEAKKSEKKEKELRKKESEQKKEKGKADVKKRTERTKKEARKKPKKRVRKKKKTAKKIILYEKKSPKKKTKKVQRAA